MLQRAHLASTVAAVPHAVHQHVRGTTGTHCQFRRCPAMVTGENRRDVNRGGRARTTWQLKLTAPLVTKQRPLPQRSCSCAPVIAGVIARHAVTAVR